MRKLALCLCLLMIGSGLAGADWTNPYWERITRGVPNHIVILENVYQRHDQLVSIAAKIPQIWGMTDPQLQTKLNDMLGRSVQEWIDETAAAAEAFAADDDLEFPAHFLPFTLIVEYETQYNKGGLLSLVLRIYEYTGGAHGMTYWLPINVDLTTGRSLTFGDLFPDQESRHKMAAVIDARLKEERDIFFIHHFTVDMFSEGQPFYVRDGEIVVFFDLYEIAPYASGIQEFVLPIE